MKATFIVARYAPRDIARYSHASAAVVLLAAALDWDVIEKPNRATILRHGDVIIEVPDHENLKFGVFRSWVRKIATHSAEFVLPMEVVTKIAQVTKLTPDHRRVLTDLAEQSVIPDNTPDEVEEQPAPTLVSREPYMAHLAGNQTYQSAASYERRWSDGHVDYECMVCGEAFSSPKSLGGHRQAHIRNGEAEPNWRDQVRGAVRGVDPDWQVTPRAGSENGTEPEPVVEAIEAEVIHEIELTETDHAEGLTEPELLSATFTVLGQHVRAVLSENARLQEENEDLRAQLAKVRSDMAGMFALMREMAGGES